MELVGRTVDSIYLQLDVDYDRAKQLSIGASLESNAFTVGGYSWKVKLYPRGSDISDNGRFLSIFLEVLNRSRVKTITLFFESFLMDKNDQPSRATIKHSVFPHQRTWGWPRFVPLTNIEANYLSEGFIRIIFAVVIISENSIPVPPSEFGKQIGALLDTMEGSDVSFIVEGEVFRAHRAVLAARSPVFREELYGSMPGGTASSITVHGMAAEIFRMVLAFIYSDSLTEDSAGFPTTLIHGLVAAADRYALNRLKLLCAKKLWDDVTPRTVGTTFMCAETYSCPELKDKCLDFVAELSLSKACFEFMYSDGGFLQMKDIFPCIVPELERRCLNSGHQQKPCHLRSSDSE